MPHGRLCPRKGIGWCRGVESGLMFEEEDFVDAELHGEPAKVDARRG